jgi:tRNA nucleotidyltransferase (CCA-adding enzyme)
MDVSRAALGTGEEGWWEQFSHGADIGVRGIGRTLARAFSEAARAMTAAVVDPDKIRAEIPVEIQCDGENVEDLFYAWLNAVIYEMSTRRMVFGRFHVEIDNYRLQATLWGEPVRPARHKPCVEVKGATFTQLSVRHDGEYWAAQCVVDV